MYEPKRGDLVSLKSNPEHRAVIAGFEKEKRLYSIVWIMPDGNPNGLTIDACALMEAQTEAPQQGMSEEELARMRAAASANAEEVQRLSMLVPLLEQYEAEIAKLKKDKLEALKALHASKMFDYGGTVNMDDSMETVIRQMLSRYFAERGEANEQITKLKAQIPV